MKGHWIKARRKSYPIQDSKMAMIHELPHQRNIHLTGYSKFAEDSQSLASELAPACRPRSSRRGSKRLSIKDVFSSSMLSVLSRSQSTGFSSESDPVHRISTGSTTSSNSRDSRKRSRRAAQSPVITARSSASSVGGFITDQVTLPDWTGDDFISDCLTSIKPGLRATPAALSSRTISLPNCSASCPSMSAKARSHTRSKSSQ
ncbi:Oidioi.mRNA.OKI2018_I69.chr1.g3576.t1.cds [Oikopleura dioica]|uniref:Oidioi.mRNA.OKI2018_I69.chr1.g3576.t1.cds n=1 Tax=Oikopleura dioica TaxID=34765 RepID=A0ABN7T008_OIKDI|nr:Oidioi.mRNA.OKI2018_I69.chr1.g3576.t1.cds [Oikopleura dioica]